MGYSGRVRFYSSCTLWNDDQSSEKWRNRNDHIGLFNGIANTILGFIPAKIEVAEVLEAYNIFKLVSTRCHSQCKHFRREIEEHGVVLCLNCVERSRCFPGFFEQAQTWALIKKRRFSARVTSYSVRWLWSPSRVNEWLFYPFLSARDNFRYIIQLFGQERFSQSK